MGISDVLADAITEIDRYLAQSHYANDAHLADILAVRKHMRIMQLKMDTPPNQPPLTDLEIQARLTEDEVENPALASPRT